MHPNHDQLFRYALAFPALLAAWLRSVLPKAIADDIDWSTFAAGKDHIPGIRLRPHIADAVCSAQRRGHPDRVWFVLEHKSYPDPDWHGQTLRYVVHLRRLLQTERHNRPPAVVAVLVYHGLQPLPGPGPDGTSPYDAFAPHLPVVVVDFARQPPEPRNPDHRHCCSWSSLRPTPYCASTQSTCSPRSTTGAACCANSKPVRARPCRRTPSTTCCGILSTTAI